MTASNGAERLTPEQAAIIGLYTGIVCGPFADVHAYAEKVYGHPIWTHEFPAMADRLKELARSDFLVICADGS